MLLRLAILSIALICLTRASEDYSQRRSGDHEEHAASIHGKGWRGWFGYAIPAAGEYHITLHGRTCRNPRVDLVVLNAESTMDEHLEETSEAYFNFTYPYNMIADTLGATAVACTKNQWGSGGSCPRVIIQQTENNELESSRKYGAVALNNNENKLSTVPFFQLQFNTSASEECNNTAPAADGTTVDAHAGHDHRRSGDHEHEHTGGLSFVIEFPATKADGTALTYPVNWYFFSSVNLTYWEFSIKPEHDDRRSGDDEDEHLALIASEVHEDPNACVLAYVAPVDTHCNCQQGWLGGDNCDDEKYFWSGMIFLTGLIGLIPLIWSKSTMLTDADSDESKNMMNVLGLLNCFGGGALLAVAVAHVFPEAIDLYPSTASDDYPAAAMLAATGYWCLLFVDKVLVAFCVPTHEDDLDAAPCTSLPAADQKETGTEMKQEQNPAPAGASGSDHGTGHGTTRSARDDDAVGVASSPRSPREDGCGMDEVLNSSNALQAVGVFLAMSVHSIFAGLALGLKCDKDGMENLAIAIVCHKCFDVSALGIILVRTQQPLYKSIPLCLFVALMTPIGTWIGIAGDSVSNHTNGALQAICAGTFLYVAIQEVLAHEFQKDATACWKLFKAIAVGLGIGMIGLASISHTRGGHSH